MLRPRRLAPGLLRQIALVPRGVCQGQDRVLGIRYWREAECKHAPGGAIDGDVEPQALMEEAGPLLLGHGVERADLRDQCQQIDVPLVDLDPLHRVAGLDSEFDCGELLVRRGGAIATGVGLVAIEFADPALDAPLGRLRDLRNAECLSVLVEGLERRQAIFGDLSLRRALDSRVLRDLLRD